eukprot:9469571-Pyramimonas_sp.AAC.1
MVRCPALRACNGPENTQGAEGVPADAAQAFDSTSMTQSSVSGSCPSFLRRLRTYFKLHAAWVPGSTVGSAP